MRDHFYRQIPHRLLAGFYTELWQGESVSVPSQAWIRQKKYLRNVNVKSEEKWWRIIGNRYFYVGLSRVLAKERLFKVIQCRCLITQWPTFTNRYFLWDLIDGSKYRKTYVECSSQAIAKSCAPWLTCIHHTLISSQSYTTWNDRSMLDAPTHCTIIMYIAWLRIINYSYS